jgi:hypothetical protein
VKEQVQVGGLVGYLGCGKISRRSDSAGEVDRKEPKMETERKSDRWIARIYLRSYIALIIHTEKEIASAVVMLELLRGP